MAQSPRDPETEEWGGHPLFPRAETETGPDPRKFDRIQLVRYHADGSREVAPKTWKGSELHSWQQILDEYGGDCTYQLVAQCGKTHKYSAWSEKWFFAGPPRKPLGNGPVGGAARQEAPLQQASQMTTQDVLLQMNLAFVKMFLEKQAAPPPNPVEMLREAAALLNGANRAPNPFEVVKEILPLMNSGEQTSRTLKQGIELAREFYKNSTVGSSAPSRSSSDDMDGIMSIVKMITAMRPANPPAAAPPAAAPAPTPPQQQYAFAPPCPPPPGYGWMYTQQGWVAFPMAMPTHAPTVNRTAPVSQPASAPAPAAPAVDEDALLHAMIANPEMRTKLQALLSACAPAPTTAPPAPPAPRPPPVPPAPVAAPSAASPASPAHVLSDMLTATGWSVTPTGEAPAAWHYTKPIDGPAPAVAPLAAVPPDEPPPGDAFEIPPDVPMDAELREMLAQPEFQEIALSLVPPEAQGAFERLVQKNALHLRETAEA